MNRHRTALEWEELIREFQESGKTQKIFCEERGVSRASLQNHLKSQFVEVSHVPVQRSSTELEVSFPDGTIVRIRS